jgi:hypothetical protein
VPSHPRKCSGSDARKVALKACKMQGQNAVSSSRRGDFAASCRTEMSRAAADADDTARGALLLLGRAAYGLICASTPRLRVAVRPSGAVAELRTLSITSAGQQLFCCAGLR